MEEKTKYNQSGKIKARLFALLLLVLSCSLTLSAYKSLRRSFDGKIVYKKVQNGFIKNNYDLYIDQEYKSNQIKDLTKQEILNVLIDNLNEYSKIGVSYFTYEDAEISMIIKKEKNSPIISLNGSNFIDQGLFWFIISLLGIIISVTIYRQTLIKIPNKQDNDIEDEEIYL